MYVVRACVLMSVCCFGGLYWCVVLRCVTRVTLLRLALCSWGVLMLLALCVALSYTLGSLVAMGLGLGLAVCTSCKPVTIRRWG
jgi:hypothetical protein